MRRSSHAFANPLLICLLVSIGFGSSIGLGTVWMRYQISHVADGNRILKARIDALERQIVEKTTVVESEQTPDQLRRRNVAFQLSLAAVSDGQVSHIPENPIERMARRANTELFRAVEGTDRPLPASLRITLPISLTR